MQAARVRVNFRLTGSCRGSSCWHGHRWLENFLMGTHRAVETNAGSQPGILGMLWNTTCNQHQEKKCVKTQVVPSSSAIWSTHVTFYQIRNRKHTGNGAFVSWETTCEAKRNMQVFIFLSYFMNRNWKMPRARNCILSLLPNPPFFFSISLSLEFTCQERFFQKKYYVILANFQEIKHRHNIIKSQCKERCLFQKQKWNWKDSFCPSLSFGH